jgi:hypothetical protein
MRANTSKPRVQCAGERGDYMKMDWKVTKRNKRLCTGITELCMHAEKSQSIAKPRKCAWCGLDCNTICITCKDDITKTGVALHLNASKGKGAGKQCFFKWHDENLVKMTDQRYSG